MTSHMAAVYTGACLPAPATVIRQNGDVSRPANDVRAAPNGVMGVSSGVQMTPNDITSVPNGVMSAPKDVRGISNDVRVIPNDVRMIPNGVMSAPNGVMSAPNGVMSAPNGVMSAPNGVRGMPNDVRMIPNDMRMVPNDIRSVPNNIKMVPSDIRGVPNDIRGVPNDIRGVPNNIKMVPSDIRGVPNVISGVPNDIRSAPNDMSSIGVGSSLEDLLRVAAACGHTDEVLALLSRGASITPDNEGRTALHCACAGGHVQTTAALLAAGCDVNFPEKSGHAPLQRAAAEGHVEVVQRLLQHGVNVDYQDSVNGNSALHEAAWKGFSGTVELMLKSGASMYLRNRGGFTPLHLACQNGHNQTCRALLLAGCDPDIRNSYGDTPLHTSARYGHAGVMRILISGDANVCEQNKNGDSALHIAAAMGRRKLTRILLEGGVDCKLKNKQEETALEIAARKEHSEILAMVRDPPVVTRVTRKQREEKRAKPESGSSSKEGSGKHVDKKKKSAKVHFERKRSVKTKEIGWSPYGCFAPPDVTDFPHPRIDTLPNEPLGNGEQYYLDLAGTIRKGPVGEGYTCYCAPFFRHVEDKLDKDKHELIHHIDIKHDKLDKKISSLEKRTRSQLTGLNEMMRGRFSRERLECCERAKRAAMRTQTELELRQGVHLRGVKDDLTAYLENKFDQMAVRGGSDRRRRAAAEMLQKSRSEEVLTDLSDEDVVGSPYLGGAAAGRVQYGGALRVVEKRPTTNGGRHVPYRAAASPDYPPPVMRSAASLSELRDRLDQEGSTETGPSELTNGTTTPDPPAYHQKSVVARLTHLAGARGDGAGWPGAHGPPLRSLSNGNVASAASTTACLMTSSRGEPHYLSMGQNRLAFPAQQQPPRQFQPLEPEDHSDQHNDSGYSTKIYGSSQGPSPALSGVPEDQETNQHHLQHQLQHQLQHHQHQIPSRMSLGPRIQALQTHLARITEDMGQLEPVGLKSSLV